MGGDHLGRPPPSDEGGDAEEDDSLDALFDDLIASFPDPATDSDVRREGLADIERRLKEAEGKGDGEDDDGKR